MADARCPDCGVWRVHEKDECAKNIARRDRLREIAHLGGLKGGVARAKLLTAQRRKEIASAGGNARALKYKK